MAISPLPQGIHENFENLSEKGVDDVFEKDKISSRSQFPEHKYQTFKQTLENIVRDYPDDPIVPYVKRRLIILDWLAGRTDADKTSAALMNFADVDRDPRSANFTRAFAASVLSKEHKMRQASAVFRALKPGDTPHFACFAFEMSRYYAEYTNEMRPEILTGRPDKEEYKRRLEFADFAEYVWIPKMSAYVKHALENPNAYRAINRDNIAGALKRAARDVHHELWDPLYMDLCKRTTDRILPELMEVLETSLPIYDPNLGCVETPGSVRSKITYYRGKVIPRLEKMQAKIEFNREHRRFISQQHNILAEPIEQMQKEVMKEDQHSEFIKAPLVKEVFIPKVNSALKQDKPFVFDLASSKLLNPAAKVDSGQAYKNLLKLGKGDIAWDGSLLTVRKAKALTVRQESNRPLKCTPGRWCNFDKLPEKVDLPYSALIVTDEGVDYLISIREIKSDGIKITYKKLSGDEAKSYYPVQKKSK